jgi:hypothetical protein
MKQKEIELPEGKNKPFKGETKDWVPGSTTITGEYPNRQQRRAANKKNKKKKK